MDSLDACLPADLRAPATTITKVSAGLSVATAEGKWWFGLALMKDSFAL
jgi:hypothetical protein